MKSFRVTCYTPRGQVVEERIEADSCECTSDQRLLYHTATQFGNITQWYPPGEWLDIRREETQQ